MQNSFDRRLKEAMDAKGLKQVDVLRIAAAQDKKLGKSQLSQYLSGKTTPRADMLAFLAEALGVDKNWLNPLLQCVDIFDRMSKPPSRNSARMEPRA